MDSALFSKRCVFVSEGMLDREYLNPVGDFLTIEPQTWCHQGGKSRQFWNRLDFQATMQSARCPEPEKGNVHHCQPVHTVRTSSTMVDKICHTKLTTHWSLFLLLKSQMTDSVFVQVSYGGDGYEHWPVRILPPGPLLISHWKCFPCLWLSEFFLYNISQD